MMTDLTDTTLTQAALIGSMLIDERCIPGVVAHVNEDDFAGEYRTVFRAIMELFHEGAAVDPVTVLHKLGDIVDYRVRMVEWMDITPSVANASAHAQALREQNILHRIQEVGMQLSGTVHLDQARTLLEEAAELAADKQSSRIFTMAEAMREFAERHSGEVNYLSWPIPELTDELGTEPGDFVIVGGRPSTGKTALTIQCAFHWAKNHKVGYFSLETDRRKVTDRLVSHAARINKTRIRRNQMDDGDWDIFAQKSSMSIVPRRLELINASGMSVSEIRAYTVMRGYDIIVIDYLQLIEEPGRNPYEAATAISKKLHTLAQSVQVTVVALSQLARLDKQNPRYATMADLRESGQIEQDADTILLLNPMDPKKPVQGQNRLLRVEKNKEGELVDIALEFEGHFQTFKKAPVTLDEHMEARGRGPAVPQHDPTPTPPPPPPETYEYIPPAGWVDPF